MMLRGIPNKYNQQRLLDQLNVDFKRQFDFVYLPIDFKNECNVGYAFINFRTADAVARFKKKFDGVDVSTCLPGLNSKKVTSVMPARIQGRAENVLRLQKSPVIRELAHRPEWLPVLLDKKGNMEHFPIPDKLPLERALDRPKYGGAKNALRNVGQREAYPWNGSSKHRR